MKDLPVRIIVAVALLALLGLVLFFGGWVQVAVLGLFTAIAVFEMKAIFNAKGMKPFVIPAVILGAGMFALMYKFNTLWLAAAFLLAFFAVAFERVLNKNRTNDDLVAALAILAYPLPFFACFGLIGFAQQDYSRLALVCIFAGVCMADNTAYFVGSLMGKHKLCPAISPKKTVEGGIGGLIGGALGGVIAYFVQRLWSFTPAPLWVLIVICFIAGLVGQVGDLFASTFKRWAGVKDYGNIFPGHGGIMDRLDSALFAAPVVYFALVIGLRLCFAF